MVGSAATVVIFDVTGAMSTNGCDIFEDGFESGDASAWNSVVPQPEQLTATRGQTLGSLRAMPA